MSSVGVHAGSSLHVLSECDVAALCEEALDVVSMSAASASAQMAFTELSVSNGSPLRVKGYRPVVIDFRVSHNDWLFLCSPGAIRRVVMNLVSNSLKYTVQGFISVKLELQKERSTNSSVGSPQQDDFFAKLTVADTGQGISAHYLKTKLFTPFSKESTAAAGSGLGLSLVQGIIKSLDGGIDIQSVVGQGTTVEIRLPLRKATPSSDKQEPNVRHVLPVDLVSWCQQKTYRIWGSETVLAPRILKSLNYYLTEWFGIREVGPMEMSDFTFLVQSDLPKYLASKWRANSDVHVIVLCRAASAQDIRSMLGSNTNLQSLEPLMVPIGPQRLAHVLKACEEGRSRKTAPEDALQQSRPGLVTEFSSRRREYDEMQSPSKRPEVMPPFRRRSQVATPSSIPTQTPPPLPIRPFPTSTQDVPIRHVSLLCVDDNEINLTLLRAYVRKVGFHDVVTAEDGLKAFEAVKQREESFDVIFMGRYI